MPAISSVIANTTDVASTAMSTRRRRNCRSRAPISHTGASVSHAPTRSRNPANGRGADGTGPACPEEVVSSSRASEDSHRLGVHGRGPRRRGRRAPPAARRATVTTSRSSTSSTPSRSTSARSSAGTTRCSCSCSRGATSSATSSRRCSAARRSWSTRGSRAASCAMSSRSTDPTPSCRCTRSRRSCSVACGARSCCGCRCSPTSPTSPSTRSGCTAASTATLRSVRSRPPARSRAAARKPARAGRSVGDRFRDAEYDRDAMRSSLGLDPDDRAVLVVAGSWGVGDVVATVEAIGQSGEFHPITVCGRDEKLRAELDERGYGTVIGWTDEMPALMTAADALVENAGGLTCMEAFAVGLPVITYLPIAGHGKDNAEMHGARGRQPLRAERRAAARRSCDRSRATAPSAARWSRPGAGCSWPTRPTTSRSSRRRDHLDRPQGPRGRPAPPGGTRAATLAAASHRVALRRPHRRCRGRLGDRRRCGQAAEGRVGHHLRRRAARPRAARARRAPPARDRCSAPRWSSTRRRSRRHSHDAPSAGQARRRHRQRRLGRGQATLLRWNRAKNDVDKTGQLIERQVGEAGPRVRARSPSRRVRCLLLATREAEARRARPHVPARETALAAAGREGLRARRSRPRLAAQMDG